MFLFLSLICTKTPVIIIPGIADNLLQVTYDLPNSPWYCSKKGKDKILFLDVPNSLPPNWLCVRNLAQLHVDNKTGLVENMENVTFEPVDFGGFRGLTHLVHLPFDFGMFGVLNDFVSQLQHLGYEIKKDLFGIPYDWRLGICLKDEFWNRMKGLIEEAYNKNGKPVLLISHSTGSVLFNKLLNERTTHEWRRKYVKKVIFLAPAWGGFGWSIYSLWTDELFPYVSLAPFTRTFAGFMSLLPNHEIFGDQTILISPEGEKLKANEVSDFLIKNSKVDEGVLGKATENTMKGPVEPDVEKIIIYNTVIPTSYGVEISDYKSRPRYLYEDGDGSVPAKGPMWACDNWKNVTCLNLNNSKITHEQMIHDRSLINLMLKWGIDDENNTTKLLREL